MYVIGNLLGFTNLLFVLQFYALFSEARTICEVDATKLGIIGAEVPCLLYFLSLLSIRIPSRSIESPQINPENSITHYSSGNQSYFLM